MTCFEQSTTIAGLVISSLVAIGTIGLATFSFLQVNRVRKQNEIRQLNDILAWAQSVINWRYSEEIIGMNLNASREWDRLLNRLSFEAEALLVISRQGKLISNVALIFKNALLNTLVKDLRKSTSFTYERLISAIESFPTNAIVQSPLPEYENAIKLVKKQRNNQNALSDKLVDAISGLFSKY